MATGAADNGAFFKADDLALAEAGACDGCASGELPAWPAVPAAAPDVLFELAKATVCFALRVLPAAPVERAVASTPLAVGVALGCSAAAISAG